MLLTSPLTADQIESITIPARGLAWLPIDDAAPDHAAPILLISRDGHTFIGECAGTGTEYAELFDLM